MGRKKNKNRQNRPSLASPSNAPCFQDIGSPNLFEVKDTNFGEEVEIPPTFSMKEPLNNVYKTVYLSGDEVNVPVDSSTSRQSTSEKKNGSRGSNSSSYHDLIDGGAYNRFRTSRQSLNRSKMDFENAGDRVMAGSRSISHRSLFTDDRSFGRSGNDSRPKTSASFAGSRVSLEWDDNMGVEENDDGRVRISRGRERQNSQLEPLGNYEEAMRKPFTRSRTVSSGGSNRGASSSHKNNNNNLLQPFSTSQHAIDGHSEDVRTFHAGSEYLQNRLSKLSIHSNNDEFVLVGGHPPPAMSSVSVDSLNREVPIPRPRSRMSSYSEKVYEKTPSVTLSQEDLLGRSISQQSLNGSNNDRNENNGHVSRSSSRYTVGTSSNTDDRLLLATRYSQSPEAEGLISHHHQHQNSRPTSRRSSASRSVASEHVGFVEIPTLYSHPDEKFDDANDEPGEPFRPTSEHSFTPTATSKTRPSLVRSDAVTDNNNEGGGGFSSSSSSLSRHDPNQPPRALLVTSALTPVVPKRHAPMSLSHSEESLVMKTPQTVQRVTEHHQKSLRQNAESVKKTVEMAVQTGNSIRLRQNQHFGDVLSECAYLPETKGIGLSPTSTTSFVPSEQPPKFIPSTDPTYVEIPKNSIRARLRHISDIYSTDGAAAPEPTPTYSSEVPKTWVEIPKNTEKPPVYSYLKKQPAHKSSEEIVVPKTSKYSAAPHQFVEIPRNIGVQRHVEIPKPKSSEKIVVPITKTSSIVEIPSNTEKSGDTIRKHIPRGRIRDLASAFDKMTGGSPARPLEFKSQVQLPRGDDGSQLRNSNMNRAETESNSDIRVGSAMSGRLSGPFNGSSSSAFRSSTQTIRSQEDRRRSTSSSLSTQMNVFTRNTFLTSSVLKPGDKSNLPSNVAMSTSYSRQLDSQAKGDGFVSAFKKASSTHLHSNDENDSRRTSRSFLSNKNSPTKDATFSEYSRKVVEVPIIGVSKPQKLRKMANGHPRAKTQEIPSGTFEFESRYESRAVSGDLNESNVFGMQKPLFAASREAFGRDTAEDLRAKQENWSQMRQHQWSSEFQMSESKNTNSMTQSPMYHHREFEEIHNLPAPTQYKTHNVESSSTRNPALHEPSILNKQSLNAMMPRHPYSPPATEDAGSRITHHTSQTLQSEDLFATEDSSIRGKIDRMFDFVESDDSRKTMTPNHESHASTDTIGTNGINTQKYHQTVNYPSATNNNRQNWNDTSSRLGGGVNKAAEMPQALKQRQELKMKSPERRNTVTVPELEYSDNELEYSLSKYREMQREQLRQRLPSTDEPQFFRSPTLTAPHAGQSLHAYRTKDLLGTPTAGEKFRFPSSSSAIKLPSALATSTPVESPSGRQSSFSINKNYSHLEMIPNNSSNPPNETFVSSISGVSHADKHADVMKKINRLSYMIENTQKQMSMNEAALLDAVKKGRRSQEIAAHRSILISRETLRLQRNELRRLHAFSAVRRPPPPVAKELRGSVVFKNLIVHLNKLFVQRLAAKDDNSYSFVGLFKFGHQVEATELVPLRVFPGEETCDKLFFVKQIQFSDVPVDFMVSIEIYAMFQRIPAAKPAELSIGSSLANKCKSLMGPPQKKSIIPVETAFKFRGRLVLDRDAQGERCLYLDDVTYPLEGTVMITTQCSRLPESFEIDFRGFLTMFHTISNMASWERYWAVLRRGVVLFWKYPDDEQMGREPKMQIDLTKCTNNSIEKCGFDLCPRANSFAIEILVDAEDGTIGSVVEKKRVLLSADTSEMLAQWLFTLNQTLDVIRGPI